MKRIVRPANPPGSTPKLPEVETPLASDISIARLLDDGLTALYREIKNILYMSAKGKLDATAARDLRDHLKLLFELKDRENELLRGLTDEQVEEQARKALHDNK